MFQEFTLGGGEFGTKFRIVALLLSSFNFMAERVTHKKEKKKPKKDKAVKK